MIKHEDLRRGMILWACDYRYNDINNKPIRHLKPTQVMVMPKSKTKRRIYYSDFYLAPIGKSGKPLKKVIPIFDNTGYRGYTGVPVQLFLLEYQCIAVYKDFKKKARIQLEEWYTESTKRYEAIKGELES